MKTKFKIGDLVQVYVVEIPGTGSFDVYNIKPICCKKSDVEEKYIGCGMIIEKENEQNYVIKSFNSGEVIPACDKDKNNSVVELVSWHISYFLRRYSKNTF